MKDPMILTRAQFYEAVIRDLARKAFRTMARWDHGHRTHRGRPWSLARTGPTLPIQRQEERDDEYVYEIAEREYVDRLCFGKEVAMSRGRVAKATAARGARRKRQEHSTVQKQLARRRLSGKSPRPPAGRTTKRIAR